MDRRLFIARSAACTTAALGIGAAIVNPARAAGAAVKPISAADYERAAKAHGFTVGAMMAAHTVYVFFDTGCPHCAQLWVTSQPLLNRIKMVWIPMGNRPRSMQVGATILQSANPAQTMADNEQAVLARKGGIEPAADVKEETLAKIKANTELYLSYDASGVPLGIFRNNKSGQAGLFDGAASADQLVQLIGL